MSLLNRTSIGTKVVLGFGLVVAVIAALGFTALRKFEALNSDVQHISEHDVTSMEYLAEMRTSMLNSRLALVREFYISTTLQERRAEDAKFRAVVEAFDKAEQGYARMGSGAEERGLYEAVAAAKATYLASAAKARDLVLDDRLAEAMPIYARETVPLAAPVDAALARVIASNVASARAGAKSAQADYGAGTVTVAVLLALGVLLAVAVGLVMVRTVAAPIRAMTAVMRRLADRDMGAQIEGVGRGDEIGAMAGAVQVFKDSMVTADRLAG
ncbi:MAG: MCP four helix bundle domain-containing protein, partial [Janthinobacterium lividum]